MVKNVKAISELVIKSIETLQTKQKWILIRKH